MFTRLSLLIVFSLVLAACATPEGETIVVTEIVEVEVEVAGETIIEEKVVEVEVTAEPVERKQILFWDQSGKGEKGDAIVEVMIAKFEGANPDIEIVREVFDFMAMSDIAKTSIEAGEGPDIMYYDAGPGFAGILANAGLLMPLDDAYAEFGWDEKLLPISRERTSYNGSVYGVGHEYESYGYFWHEGIFAKEGVSPPESLAELNDLCVTFRELGYDTPMSAGWVDGWPLSLEWDNFVNNYISNDKLTGAISGDVPWNDPEIVETVQMFRDHLDICHNMNEGPGLSYEEGNSLMYSGVSPMMHGSTARLQDFTPEMEDEFSWDVFPPIEGRERQLIELIGSAWFIPADTEYPEEALRWLNYLISDEAVQMWLEDIGQVPTVLGIDFSTLNVRPVQKDFFEVLAAWDGPYGFLIPAYVSGNFNTVYFAISEVAADRQTPQEFADALEVEMRKSVEEGTNLDLTP